MASEQTLRAVIGIVDRFSAPLHVLDEKIERAAARLEHMNKRFAAFSAPIVNIRKHLGELGEEVGLVKLGERAERATEHFRRLRERAVEILPALSALSGIVSIAGIAEVIKSSSEYGEHLYLTSRATGLSGPQLGGLEYAGKLAGVGQEQIDRGVEYLNRTISEAARGKNKDAELLLSRLGMTNTPGHMAGTAQALRAVSQEAQQLVKSGNVQLASDMMSKLFGSRSGVLLLPAFQQGWEHISELMEQAQKHGLAPSDDQIRRAAEFQEQFKQLSAAITGTELSIADKLYPTLTPIIERMTEWLDVNREWIATKIGDEFRYIVDTLKSMNWNGIGEAMRFIGDGAIWAANHLWVVESVLALIAAAKIGRIALDLWAVAAAVVGVTARIVALGTAARIAVGSTGIGLLILAAYEIYSNWDTIEPWIEGVLKKIVDFSKWAWQQIQKDAGPAIDWIWQKWMDFGDWLTNHVPASVSRLWTGGGDTGPALKALSSGQVQAASALFSHLTAPKSQGGLGLDRAHALAILGNADAESSLNPAARGDHGTSLGMFQWHGARGQEMLRALGDRAGDSLAQLDYAVKDQMRRDPGWFAPGSVTDLTNRWETGYERPASPADRTHFADRIAAALEKPIGGKSAAAAPKLQGRIDVTVNHHNAPPGTTATVTGMGSDDLELGGLGQAFAY